MRRLSSTHQIHGKLMREPWINDEGNNIIKDDKDRDKPSETSQCLDGHLIPTWCIRGEHPQVEVVVSGK